MSNRSELVVLLGIIVFVSAWSAGCSTSVLSRALPDEKPAISNEPSPPIRKILQQAREQMNTTRSYTDDYLVIQYPNGDVPVDTGACTDVIVRSFRSAGVDLQKEVHEDMAANFSKYPKKWGLTKTDTNIDHRRVPNLQTFFTRKGKSLPITADSGNYRPGDVVSWDLNGKGLTHIGLVSDLWDSNTRRYLIIHNIGYGANADDCLFEWKITGHFRYF